MRRLIVLVTVLLPLLASGYEEYVEVDGLYYERQSSGEAKLCRLPSYVDLEYVVIRDSVAFDGKMYPVTSIGYGIFEECKRLKSVSGRLIQRIDSDAFIYCDSLKSVDFPNVTYLGNYVFAWSGLDSISLPKAEYIGESCFCWCKSLRSVCLPSVKVISSHGVFNGCSLLSDIRVGDSLANVGDHYNYIPFVGGTAWLEAQPDGMVHLGPVAIDWKGDPPAYGSYVFDRCKRIGSCFFRGFNGQYQYHMYDLPVEVTIGESVDLVNKDVFLDCENVRVLHYNAVDCDVVVRPYGRYYGPDYTPFGKNFIREPCECPEHTYDEYYKELIPLNRVTFGDSVRRIPGYLLCDQELKYGFTLPASLDSIGDKALWCGTNDEYVTCHAIVPPACGIDAVKGWKLRVPECSVALYESTSPWSNCTVTALNRSTPDINGDGPVDIADVNILINMMLGKDVAEMSPERCDQNGDGVIDIADVNLLLNVLLGKEYVPIAETETFTANGVSFNMVRVDGGRFIMGGTAEQGGDTTDSERPWHVVRLSDYSIGQTEVTQELWQAVMGNNPSRFTGNLKRPVETVSWEACQTFLTKLNVLTGQRFRLPTEAEWEYAARGGSKNHSYKYAGSDGVNRVAWTHENSGSLGSDNPGYGTHPVGAKIPNELGIYDMTGNVMEWCADWYGDYSSEAQTDPTGPETGSERIRRGGGWNYSAPYCRNSFRGHSSPRSTSPGVGLRLAM